MDQDIRDDRQYILVAFQDLTLEDAENTEREGEDEEEVEKLEGNSQRTEEYDGDQSGDDTA